MNSLDAAAKAINDGGWTCDLHEPEPFGECGRCEPLQRQLVTNVLDAFSGGKQLYRGTDVEPDDLTAALEYGEAVQVWPLGE